MSQVRSPFQLHAVCIHCVELSSEPSLRNSKGWRERTVTLKCKPLFQGVGLFKISCQNNQITKSDQSLWHGRTSQGGEGRERDFKKLQAVKTGYLKIDRLSDAAPRASQLVTALAMSQPFGWKWGSKESQGKRSGLSNCFTIF